MRPFLRRAKGVVTFGAAISIKRVVPISHQRRSNLGCRGDTFRPACEETVGGGRGVTTGPLTDQSAKLTEAFNIPVPRHFTTLIVRKIENYSADWKHSNCIRWMIFGSGGSSKASGGSLAALLLSQHHRAPPNPFAFFARRLRLTPSAPAREGPTPVYTKLVSRAFPRRFII
ncbi:unnamed protein product, partial [Iphiclides podalirius]